MAKKKKGDRVGIGTLFLWKSRDIAFSGVSIIVLTYLSIFCTDALGMSAATVGTILLVSRVIDAFTDLIGGYIVDRTHTRFGKARPYEICIVFEWLFTVLLFFADKSWSSVAKVAWIFSMYTVTYAIFNTLLDSSETPYMVRAFHGKRSLIAKVASYGGIISMFASVLITMIFPKVMASLAAKEGGMSSVAMWRRLIIMFAVPLAVIGMLRFFFIKEDPSIDAKQKSKLDVHEALTMMTKNKYVWAFAGMYGVYGMVTGLAAGSYYFTYIVGNIGAFGMVGLTSIVLLPVLFMFPKMMKKWSLGELYISFTFLSIIGYLGVFIAKSNLVLVLLMVLLTSTLSLPEVYMKPLCITDLGIYNEYLGYHRMEGTAGSLAGFLNKLMTGLGAGMTGWILSLAGYVKGAGGNAAVQPHSALFAIRSLYSLIPMVGAIVILLCAIAFARLEKQLPAIQKAIKSRNDDNQEVDNHAANAAD